MVGGLFTAVYSHSLNYHLWANESFCKCSRLSNGTLKYFLSMLKWYFEYFVESLPQQLASPRNGLINDRTDLLKEK